MDPITGAALITAGASLFGANKQANAARDAANQAAQAQLQAAKISAEAQKFRPVGITTNFGSSTFGFDKNGYLKSAGYQLSPELKAQQDQIMAGARENLSDAQRLSMLGRGYLASTPEEVAQNWLSKQNALLAPERERQYAQLQQNLFNTGRGGLAVSQGGGLGAANPEMQAYYNAIAQQDAQNALAAQQYGQQQLTFGQGLLSGAYAPYSTALGTAATIEQLGQSPLDIGAQLGGRSATAGANVGRSLLEGGMGAAKTLQEAKAQSGTGDFFKGLATNPYVDKALQNYLGGGGNAGYTYNSPYGTNYGVTANYGLNTPSVWSTPDYTSGANYGFSSGGSYGLQPTGGTGFVF